MTDHFKLKGLRFYKYEDSVPKVVKLVSYDDVNNEYEVIDRDTKNKIRINADKLESDWVKLNPDALIDFSLCTAIDNQNDEVPDCKVTLHRKLKGVNSFEAKPYLACRQAVIDIFALLQQSRYIAGMCISQDTCPPEVNFDGCYAYKTSTYNVLVAAYIDDTLDEILSVFNHKKFDDRLRLIKSRDQMGIDGYVDNLYDFMHNNWFMYDFHRGFDIHEFAFKSFDFEDYKTNKILTEYIIRNKYEVPTRFYPVHYNKSIDLSEIKRRHILICPDSYQYPDGQIILLGYDISETVSFKDYINKGHSPKDALKATMKDLGWS